MSNQTSVCVDYDVDISEDANEMEFTACPVREPQETQP